LPMPSFINRDSDGGTLTGGYTPWLCSSRDITICPSVM